MMFTYQSKNKVVDGVEYTSPIYLYEVVQTPYKELVQQSIEVLQNLTNKDIETLVLGLEGPDSRKKTASVQFATVEEGQQVVIGYLTSLKLNDVKDSKYTIVDRTVGNTTFKVSKRIDTGKEYVMASIVNRTLVQEGDVAPKKSVNSLRTTLIKNKLNRMLPHTNIQTFSLDSLTLVEEG